MFGLTLAVRLLHPRGHREGKTRTQSAADRHLAGLFKLIWFSQTDLVFPELFPHEGSEINSYVSFLLCFSTYEFLHTCSILRTQIVYVCVYKYFSLFNVLCTETPMRCHTSLSYQIFVQWQMIFGADYVKCIWYIAYCMRGLAPALDLLPIVNSLTGFSSVWRGFLSYTSITHFTLHNMKRENRN